MKLNLLRAFLTVAIGLLIASPVLGASLFISEFPNGLSQISSTQPQILPAPALVDQTPIAVGGGSLQSAAFGAQTKAVRLMCDVGCSVALGTNPTATTSTFLLQQGVPVTFGVSPGWKVAVIANTAGNTASGGGGAVTIADGADVTQGAVADSAVAAGAAGTVNAHLRTISGQLPATVGQKAMAASLPVTIASDQSSFPVTVAAGSAIIGNVRIDQTTPGTTNGVVVNSGTLTTLTTLTGTTTLTPGTAAANLGKAEDAIAGSGDTGIATWCVQQSAPADTAANADYGPCQVSGGGVWVQPVPTATAGAGVTSVVSSAAESNHVIKGSAGNLFGFSVTTGATSGYVFVSNTTTAPTAGGAAIAPIKCYVIAANSTLGVTYSPPLVLSTGITLVFSTTGCFVNTASTTAFISGDAK